MQIVTSKIPLKTLHTMAVDSFGNLVKAVVDVEKEIMAIDGQLHADEETLLLENGSKQENLWGINLYPELDTTDFIEFDSMINLRPSVQNMSRSIEDPKLRNKIIAIVAKLVIR